MAASYTVSITGFQKKSFTVKDIPAAEFIRAYAEYLKKSNKVKIPEWVEYIKLGTGKQLAPLDADWVYTRIAAVARKVYLRQNVGVVALSHFFGHKKKFGVREKHHVPVAKKIIRWSLQQLEGLGVLSKDKKSELKRLSRRVSSEGQRDMDRIADQVAKGQKI
eukprot:TRINITY_DN0_c5164_g1_i4.p2 TRINITY_DN0_c5164_g1~~TRINITY_DN0_c5164_g1_i4.p2  ORF type:complete len:163 (+),score=60.45 TRINITY_DN0_c5164_g1_i4:66-554(+)